MIRKIPRIYIDTCCFINAIKGYKEGHDKISEDVWYTKKVLEASKNGDMEVFTSTLTVAECLYVDESPKKLDDETKRLIKSILTSGKICKLIQTHLGIAEKTRDICWQYQITYKGADGVHLASAVMMNCDEFFTIDRLAKRGNLVQIFEQNFNLKIIHPNKTQCLPSKYKQKDLPVKAKKKS